VRVFKGNCTSSGTISGWDNAVLQVGSGGALLLGGRGRGAAKACEGWELAEAAWGAAGIEGAVEDEEMDEGKTGEEAEEEEEGEEEGEEEAEGGNDGAEGKDVEVEEQEEEQEVEEQEVEEQEVEEQEVEEQEVERMLEGAGMSRPMSAKSEPSPNSSSNSFFTCVLLYF